MLGDTKYLQNKYLFNHYSTQSEEFKNMKIITLYYIGI